MSAGGQPGSEGVRGACRTGGDRGEGEGRGEACLVGEADGRGHSARGSRVVLLMSSLTQA